MSLAGRTTMIPEQSYGDQGACRTVRGRRWRIVERGGRDGRHAPPSESNGFGDTAEDCGREVVPRAGCRLIQMLSEPATTGARGRVSVNQLVVRTTKKGWQ